MELGKKKSFFGRLSQKIGDVVMGRPSIDEEMYEELEEALITSDIGMETTMNIIERLREEVKRKWPEPEEVGGILRDIIAEMMDKGEANKLCGDTPLVILMIGINGGGKTTSIGKIAHKCKEQGKSVLLAAADTFRAAAADQLEIWAERVGVNMIRHQEGSDPSAVIFDAIQAAKARNTDVLICDTAGRLQNKKNLMDELAKMNRIIEREYPEAARETLLVLDATTGKNAVSQAKEFNDSTELTGIVLTKLDGTAKGGIVVTITDEFDLPVKFIGVGEGIDDLKEFDAQDFAGGIFDE
ncbi:MAG: signal recognition particle-docking protein FtsY [Firmicutes bacterium]|nr:signal recognition particle-docking protein FtsY [Bacillota bacterium]MBQ1401497.1 signal recognition particle-docking protein FtsY [Bacillota bacterium]MBR2512393.1 signal recognition particle-docking protein FtsY [Bacillota bacterium]